jgi:hypothetical protein
MTTTELNALIGRLGLLRVTTPSGKTLQVPVKVLDAKRAWGNLRYEVTPLHNGRARPDVMGRDWVGSERVTLEEL